MHIHCPFCILCILLKQWIHTFHIIFKPIKVYSQLYVIQESHNLHNTRFLSRHSIVANTCLIRTSTENISVVSTISYNYHIFCCNMFVFACLILARSQCWLFALRTNTRQISILALKYPYLHTNSTSGICTVISKIICQST